MTTAQIRRIVEKAERKVQIKIIGEHSLKTRISIHEVDIDTLRDAGHDVTALVQRLYDELRQNKPSLSRREIGDKIRVAVDAEATEMWISDF